MGMESDRLRGERERMCVRVCIGRTWKMVGECSMTAVETRYPGCGLESDWKPFCRKVI